MSTPAVDRMTAVAPARAPQTFLAGALLLVVAAFWSTWQSLPAVWSADRSHGFLAAALCGWLVWRDRELLTAGRAPLHLAWPALIALSLLWLVAAVISVQVVQIAVLPLLLLAWLLAVFGMEVLPAAWPVAAVFFLAVPLWEVLVWPLQMLTVLFNAVLLKIIGLEAVIRGESISIPSGTLVVAGSCSGINYLMTAVTIAACYAMLFVQRWSTRWRLVLAAALLAMLANWIRVLGLVLIAHATKMQSPLMAEHGTYGWVIFAAAMLTFFAVAARLERRERRQLVNAADSLASSASAPATAHAGSLAPPARKALAIATFAAVLGPLLYIVVDALPVADTALDEAPGLAMAVSWQGPSASASSWTPAYQGASSSRVAHVTIDGADVQINRLIWGHQTQGGELIGGNRIASDSVLLAERMVGPLDASARMVREAAIREGGNVRLVWYWYRVANVNTPSPARAKLLELVSFVARLPASELITASALCNGNECKDAHARLFAAVTGRAMDATTSDAAAARP
jgi:EpsI family protein